MSERKYKSGDKFILEITDIDEEIVTQGYPKPAYMVKGMNGAFSENVLDKLERIPERKEVMHTARTMMDFERKGFQKGWNACVDALGGK